MMNEEDLVVCLQFKSYRDVISSQVLACKDSGYDWFEQLLQNVSFLHLMALFPPMCVLLCVYSVEHL